jgi:ABC-type multidrug transport system fused ATPase/permease subunit
MVSVIQVWTADKLIPIIENALDGNKSKMIESIIYYLKLILGLIILTYLRNLIAYKISSKCEKKLYEDAIQSLSKKGIAYFDNNDSGNIISILNNDTKKIKGFIRNDLIQIIYVPVLFLIILFYMLNISKTLTIIVFVLITLTNIFAFVKSSNLDDIALEVKTAEGDLNSLEKEILNNEYSIRITNASKFFNCRYKNLVEKLNEKEILLAKMSAINYIPSLINEYVPLIIVIIFGSLFVAKGKISIGQFTAYIQLMTYLCLPMSKYAKMIVDLRFTMASVIRYNNIFSFKDERADGYPLYINGNNQKDTPIVKFEHVTFSYNDKKNVLSDINFSVNKCEKIGIVGPTGCGKSTILKLIMGFYANQSGKILFNGNGLSNIKLESLREHISLVDQNKYIFPDTVAYNISSGRHRDYQEDEKGILKAANDAMISGYVLKKMNKGFNSILYQSGSNLSEGQKTRLALARAFYTQLC